jgi:3-isopropylmalate dehydratase small subunit
MENIEPNFAQRVEVGDIIVAGRNFGCGSSREHAPLSIKGCGISAVVAASFARIFFRNAINIGLPIIELKEVDRISASDILEIDLARGIINNISRGERYTIKAFPNFLQELIRKGGLLNWVKVK